MDASINPNASTGAQAFNSIMLDSLKDAKLHEIEELKTELIMNESKKDQLKNFLDVFNGVFATCDGLFEGEADPTPRPANGNRQAQARTMRRNDSIMSLSIDEIDRLTRMISSDANGFGTK